MRSHRKGPPPSKCDIVYLAKGRPEFTAASLAALAENTNWTRVRFVWVFSDGDRTDWNRLNAFCVAMEVEDAFLDMKDLGGPVAIMNHFLSIPEPHLTPLWVKLDNDVIVPPGWLDACLAVMDAHPELDLLGIEPAESRTPAPWAGGKRVPAPEHSAIFKIVAKIGGLSYANCDSIGGIGMFRTRAWRGRAPMVPHSTYGGFTDWQLHERPQSIRGHGMKPLVVGWIVPPLKLFLLDRLPIEPWVSLSERYIIEGSQRRWTNYSAAEAESLAGWWLRDNIAK